MEKHIREELFEQATKTGASLTIEKGVDSEIINALRLDRPDLVEEVYEKHNLHVDARFVNYDDFTGLQASALFKAIESMGYFVSAGASTSLTNKVGRNALWYVTARSTIKHNLSGDVGDRPDQRVDQLNLTKQMDKLLVTAELARTPEDQSLDDTFKKQELAKLLRFRFDELQRYQDVHTEAPIPTETYLALVDMLVNDDLDAFKACINCNNGEKQNAGKAAVSVSLANRPIENITPFFQRTYLRHEIFKRIHLCPKIYKYFVSLPDAQMNRNAIDSNGREAEYFLSEDYLASIEED